MKTILITSQHEFAELRSSWDNLYNRCGQPSPFISFEWVYSSYAYDECKPFIILIYSGAALIAAYPLKIKNLQLIKFASRSFLTHACDNYADYAEMLIDSTANKKAIIQAFVGAIVECMQNIDFLKIDNISDRKQENRLFLKALRDTTLYKSTFPNVYNPVLNISCAHYIDKNRIKDIERRERKLKKQHAIDYHIAQTVLPGSPAWQKLVLFHSKRFSGEGFSHNSNQHFYRLLLENGFDWSQTDFSYMTVDSEIVACHFGFKNKKEFLYYVPAYSDDFRSHSVGMLLLYKIINHYAERDYSCFNLLRGSEPYKIDWMSDDHANYTAIATRKKISFNSILLNLFMLKKLKPYMVRVQ